ncbi:MAG: WG repeat-containing protein [Lachnospiraceae bacterium]|nr:WG repeat-containing protein [Lachnospiraceae bacterium]
MKCKNCGAEYDGDKCPYCGNSPIKAQRPKKEIVKSIVEGTNYIIVKIDDKKGLINTNGHVIIPVEYDYMSTVWDNVNLLKEYGIVYVGKDTDFYLYDDSGNCLCSFNGNIDIKRPYIIIKHSKASKISIFNMETNTFLWKKIGVISRLFGRYSYTRIENDYVVLDRCYNEIFRFDNVQGISFEREVNIIKVWKDRQTISIYTPQFKLLCSFPANYQIDEVINSNYILCSYFKHIKNSRSRRVWGVFDSESQTWLIPIEYVSVKFNEDTSEFEVGKSLRDDINEEIEADEAKKKEDDRRRHDAKKPDILKGTIWGLIGVILLVIFIANSNQEDIIAASVCCLLGSFIFICMSVYYFLRDYDD